MRSPSLIPSLDPCYHAITSAIMRAWQLAFSSVPLASEAEIPKQRAWLAEQRDLHDSPHKHDLGHEYYK